MKNNPNPEPFTKREALEFIDKQSKKGAKPDHKGWKRLRALIESLRLITMEPEPESFEMDSN